MSQNCAEPAYCAKDITVYAPFQPLENRLETLKGDRAGQYSIRINEQWRICFRWEEGDAYDVVITDYH